MPIVAAFMLPHPPIILSEIGRGEEEKIALTRQSYERVADEIAELAPETIIISSPHTVMYGDYFHISPGEGAEGDMSAFNAGEVKFREKYDTELVEAITAEAFSYSDKADEEKEDFDVFPAGTLGEKDKKLDHGTMIPLYFIRQKYNDFKIVRIGLSGLPLSTHYEMGKLIKKAVEKTGRRAVYIGSGDLSHKMKAEGPYGYAAEGPIYDERIMKVCSSANFGDLFDFDENFLDRAAECGHRSFLVMAGALDGLSVKAEELSHEATFGVGYGICRFEIGEADEERHFLKKWREVRKQKIMEKRNKEDAYVRLARFSLESFIRKGVQVKQKDIDERLMNELPSEIFSDKAGAFVSIHKEGLLRGCIGTIMPTCECLADEIMQNAISAAVKDPRFPKIRENELPLLEINVDVLGEPEPIDGPDMLDVKKYGVIVTAGYRRGLLLPDLEGVDTVEQQIEIACNKAGIGIYEDYSLERFEVVRHI